MVHTIPRGGVIPAVLLSIDSCDKPPKSQSCKFQEASLPKETYLHVGGVVAMGFSRNGDYLLVISHSGAEYIRCLTGSVLQEMRNLRIPKTV